jgi:hypothetical protein
MPSLSSGNRIPVEDATTRVPLIIESGTLNARVVAGAGISPDDLMIQLAEGPGVNLSFGQGLVTYAAETGTEPPAGPIGCTAWSKPRS